MSLLEEVILRGTRAAQPGASSVAAGTLYYVTDETAVERSSGTAWETYSGGGAPADAQYIVGAAHASLSAERVGTDTAEIAWDYGTAAQAKLNLINNSIVAARTSFVATQRILGRNTAGAGAGEEVTWEQARAWATQKIWTPDYPPASAGALDDEFADVSGGLPGGWTEYDHGTLLTPVEGSEGFRMQMAAGTVNFLAGAYKSDPGGDITVWTKVSLSATRVNSRVGLAWFQDAASSTGDLHAVVMAYDTTSMYVITSTYTGYNTGVTNVITLTDVQGGSGLYFRTRRTGTTYTFEWSSDGVGWMVLSSGAIAFVPLHVGLIASSNGSAAGVAVSKFFRSVASDVGVGGLVGGQRI